MAADAFLVEEIYHLLVPLPALGRPNCAANQRPALAGGFAALSGSGSGSRPVARAPALHRARRSRRMPRILIAKDRRALGLIGEGGRGEEEEGEGEAHGGRVSCRKVDTTRRAGFYPADV
ncbi:hypothetical protein SAMN05444000_1036 [Shimia gijangensis]|uniref:Uncharacterized protein n=1 Tax=Shimia gijangensis TaxID=1470563 RepID=A0A1M6DU40_9RHOB|nr:hypothetical protein SAMN05444000_1036 [Shimia gijangensis]